MDSTKNSPTNKLNALSLQLYSFFFPAYYLLELSLKDKLFHLIKMKLGSDWFTRQLLSAQPGSVFFSEIDLILRRKRKGYCLSDDGLLLESGFGFWVEFFSPALYKLTEGLPIQVFPKLPREVKRSDLYSTLTSIKDFRNNLYHSRIPLVTSAQEITYLQLSEKVYQDLNNILVWLDSPHRELLDIREFGQTAKAIHSLLENS